MGLSNFGIVGVQGFGRLRLIAITHLCIECAANMRARDLKSGDIWLRIGTNQVKFLIWLLSLPFRLLGIVVEGVFEFLRAVILLPARVLGGRPS